MVPKSNSAPARIAVLEREGWEAACRARTENSEDLWRRVLEDPFARRQHIKLLIEEAQVNRPLDHARFLDNLRLGLARRSKGTQLALPLFSSKSENLLDSATRALCIPDFGKDPSKSPLTSVSWERRAIVAVDAAHKSSLELMIAQYERLQERLRADLLDHEYLMDPRRAAWLAAIFLDHACVLPSSVVQKKFGNLGDVLYYRNQTYVAAELPGEMVFLIATQCPKAHDIVHKLGELAKTWELFWSDDNEEEVDIPKTIKSHLKENRLHLITSRQFLSGTAGLTAVVHKEWKTHRGVITVELLVERLGDAWGNAWRWLLCNREAVEALFRGKDMQFHDWQTGPVPKFLPALLKKGKPIVP